MRSLNSSFAVKGMKSVGFFAACMFLAAAAVSAHADSIVYNNAGPDSWVAGSGAATLSNDFSASDSFSLSSPASVDAISFGLVIAPVSTLDSVDWAITTLPNGGTTVASGAATTLSTAYEGPDEDVSFDNVTFDIVSVPLAADTTYYLQLSNATTPVRGDYAAWGESDNPDSTAYEYHDGTLFGTNPIPSETFALYGTTSVVPEPPGLVLLGSGVAGLALFCAMRRRRPGAAQAGICA